MNVLFTDAVWIKRRGLLKSATPSGGFLFLLLWRTPYVAGTPS